MTNISRRTALLGSTMLGLGACSTLFPTPTPTPTPAANAQVASDITLVDGAIQVIASGLGGLGSVVSAATVATIQEAASAVHQVAVAFSTAAAAPAQQTWVQQLAADASSIIQALSGVGLPSAFQTALSGLATLIPVIEFAVGLLAAHPRVAGVPMQPNTARGHLENFIASNGKRA